MSQSQDYPCHCNIRNTWCGCGGSKTETTRENIIGAGCLIGKRLRLTKEGTRMKTRVKKWEKKKVIIYIYIVHLLLSRAWSLQLHKDHKSSWGHVMWYLLPCYGVHGGAGNLPWVTEKKTRICRWTVVYHHVNAVLRVAALAITQLLLCNIFIWK